MRRNEKEIIDRAQIDAIIRRNRVCRLGLSDGGQPYVVPLCFGYDGTAVYLHCATAGRKLEVLRRNPRVCVEFDSGERLVEGERACAWGMKYQSVIAFGTARFIEAPEQKRAGLRLVMAQYADPERAFSFSDDALSRTVVIKVDIDRITGKQSV